MCSPKKNRMSLYIAAPPKCAKYEYVGTVVELEILAVVLDDIFEELEVFAVLDVLAVVLADVLAVVLDDTLTLLLFVALSCVVIFLGFLYYLIIYFFLL